MLIVASGSPARLAHPFGTVPDCGHFAEPAQESAGKNRAVRPARLRQWVADALRPGLAITARKTVYLIE
jgi:hypothetical protein